jgi:hypothetical protein
VIAPSLRHSLRRGAPALVIAAMIGIVAPAEAAHGAAPGLAVSPAHVSTRLGQRFTVSTEVANRGATPLHGLIAHLNVVGLTRGVYVDPEDWSSSRTQHVPDLTPGRSATLRWPIKAVNGGDFGVYVVVLPGHDPARAAPGVSVTRAVDVHVAQRRTLNSGGVLPLAIGLPALLGAAALGMRIRRRR